MAVALGMIGSAAIGAAGSALAESGGGSKEEERLMKAKRKQQEMETQVQKEASAPTNLMANYLARDAMIKESAPGPAGDMARMLNTINFVQNQALPWLQGSNIRRQQSYQQFGVQGPGQYAVASGLKGLNAMAQRWQDIRKRLGGK